ncbi:MAG: methyl-accepting chemotaxis protein [Methyloprofundus sp.]|nr:MAG: methyl-accepting chemotaxis protein [Methyloprofundus sp.]
MKINMPVTDHEVHMADGTILVTETDTKGIITKANEAFVEISGYSEPELIGKNHNIVRHPDMPPEAFEDLWSTVKAHKPWVGMVKNRCKNGDYYWVEANVTPIYKNGQYVGIMSCRYAPSREQVRSAEDLYDKIKKKQATLEETGLLHKLNFIKRLSFGQKLAAMGFALLLPALILIAMLFLEKNIAIDFANKEIKGSEYLVPLKGFLSDTAKHRGLTNAYFSSGNAVDTSSIMQTRRQILEAIKAVDHVDALYGDELSSSKAWQSIKQQWAQLEGRSLKLSKKQNFTQHTDLINNVLALFVQVGDSSNLILDPDLDSYYLMDMQVVRLPELMENLGKLRGYGAGLAGQSGLTQAQLIKLVVLKEKVDGLLSASLHDIGTATTENEQLAPVFTDQKNDLSNQVTIFLTKVDQLMTAPSTVSAKKLFSQGTAAIAATNSLADTTAVNLKKLLEIRSAGFSQSLYIGMASITLLIMVVVFLAYQLLRYFKKQTSDISGVFYRLTDGKYRNTLDLTANDEFGAMLQALQSMQVKLNVDLAEAKELANTGQRIQQALDNVESCVMVANNNLEIIYMNSTVQKMFKNAEADIQTQLPNFKADALLGANIDQFHKNPAHQRGLIPTLTGTFKSSLEIGGRHMDFVANPVTNDAGERIGTVVEWRDKTHEVKIEQEIEAIVEGVKVGQLSARIEMADKEGFFKKLSGGINELTDVIERVFSDVSSTMESMAMGDLTNQIDNDYEGTYLDCKNNINVSLGQISEIVSQINESARFIKNSSQEVASGNNNLSQRAEQQASSLEETASSMEELTNTVKNNADNAQQANQVATTARQLAEQGGSIVSSAIAAMQEINVSSNKIAEIIGVIDEIAFQTNLLALNASVEAARAGEQGRGFSVVATEVRNLAQRSATAAKESKELIQTSVLKVRSGTDFVNETGKSLNEIVIGVKKVSDIVAEIAAASEEQSQGIEQVNQAVSQMDEITQQNAALAEQASAASVSMSDQSNSMAQLLGFFKAGLPGNAQPHSHSQTSSRSNTLDFASARSKHLSWKARLRNFLDGKEALTLDQAVSHRDCDLGKWLYSTGMSTYGYLPAMVEMEKLHAQMHGIVQSCIKNQDKGNTRGATQDYSTVSDLSTKIVELLTVVEENVSGNMNAAAKPVTQSRSANPNPAQTYTPTPNSPADEDEWEDF